MARSAIILADQGSEMEKGPQMGASAFAYQIAIGFRKSEARGPPSGFVCLDGAGQLAPLAVPAIEQLELRLDIARWLVQPTIKVDRLDAIGR